MAEKLKQFEEKEVDGDVLDFNERPLPSKEEPFFQQQTFDYGNLRNAKETITHHIHQSVDAVNADVTLFGTGQAFWIAPRTCTIESIKEVHGTAGTDAGAVTLNVEKLTGTQATGAGTDILSSGISLKGATNTVVTGTFVTTSGVRGLLVNERLGVVVTGTPTAINNVTIVIEVKYT